MDKKFDNCQKEKLPFHFGWASHIGQVRQKNEDAYQIKPQQCLFLVSDGMGGYQGGGAASKIVAEVFPNIISEKFQKLRSGKPTAIRNLLKKSIVELNHHIRTVVSEKLGFKNMGATVVVLIFKNNRAFITNLGDSRAYLLRQRRLRLLSKDHTVIDELIQSGQIQPQQSENHPAQGQITQYIGIDDQTAVHVKSIILQTKDRFLLCSDGLTDVLDDETIKKILEGYGDPELVCKELTKTANQISGHDNITAVVVDWLI